MAVGRTRTSLRQTTRKIMLANNCRPLLLTTKVTDIVRAAVDLQAAKDAVAEEVMRQIEAKRAEDPEKVCRETLTCTVLTAICSHTIIDDIDRMIADRRAWVFAQRPGAPPAAPKVWQRGYRASFDERDIRSRCECIITV